MTALEEKAIEFHNARKRYVELDVPKAERINRQGRMQRASIAFHKACQEFKDKKQETDQC